MIELLVIGILGFTDLALMVGFYLMNKEMTKERNKFVNALIAKNAREMQDLEFTQKVEPRQEERAPDLVPIESLSDEEWAEKVLGQVG